MHKYQYVALGIVTSAVVFVAIVINLIMGIDVVYTHLFYIPIIMAGIWYHKKAVYLALFLGAFHMIINYAAIGSFEYNTLLRAFIFLIIAYIVGMIAEKKDLIYARLKSSEEQLLQMRETLELRVQERTSELNRINESLKNEIIERKNIEKALKKSRAILSRAQSIAHVGNWAWDLTTDRQQWSDEVFRIFGHQPQDFQPTVDWLISNVHVDDRERVRRFMEEALHEKKLFNIDYRVITRQGSVRHVNNVADKFREDPAGHPLWLYGILQDITGRKSAEDERMRLASRVILLLESTGEGIYGVDLNDCCMFMNRSAGKMLGYAPEDVIGKNTHKLFHYKRNDGSPYPEEECPNVMTIKTGRGHRIFGELFWKRDGTSFPVEYSSYPILDNGAVRGVVVVFNDITERKKAEEALLASKAQAELYVDIMGHDIGNIDQAIMGYLEMAIETLKLDDEQRELITKPIELVMSSARLIDNVKKLQRIKAGTIPLEKVDLGEVLSEVKAEYSSVPERDVRINYAPVTGYNVMANELLKDVFSNIVGNAVKHSKGALVVNIGIRKASIDAKNYYRVDIDDNGPGISDMLKLKLFVETRGETKAERRGLGLHLVNLLVRLFSGIVWVEDRVPGDHTQGSRFVVMLPALI